MRDVKITLSIINFLSILDCSIEKKINDHGRAVISGYIDSKDEEKLLQYYTGNQFAGIEIETEEKDKLVLFAGILESLKIETVTGLKKATVTLVGGTRVLEGANHTRTFQNKSMTYDELVYNIEKNYNGTQHIMFVGSEKPINKLIVQYNETDWNFLKRIASHHNACLIPLFKSQKTAYSIGLPSSGFENNLESISYSIENNSDEFYRKQDNDVKGLSALDAYYYRVQSRDIYDLGDGVRFEEIPLHIYSVETNLIGGELLHTYQLKKEGGFKAPKIYNKHMIGASLAGTILSIKNDTVKVLLHVDGKQDEATAKWFPYSTIYSSPDGTGWYCMPEKNDKIRLYFPNEKEEDGYIISSINTETGIGAGGSNIPRSNPDNKSISTKYNKQVELTPTSITITNNKGMSIKLDDDEGISIISDKDVIIQSDETLSIQSLTEAMRVDAKESIELIQGETKITIKDDVIVEGAMFKVQ